MIHAGNVTSLGFSAESIDFKSLPQFTIAPASLADVFKANWKKPAVASFLARGAVRRGLCPVHQIRCSIGIPRASAP
ncbi:MAG: hypothetical protein MZV63_65100 [Marinilabiliales bacterium]|nr:hypothetical protein [Marinilabiliales bacterium]